jgi:signal transduction histidine kinase
LTEIASKQPAAGMAGQSVAVRSAGAAEAEGRSVGRLFTFFLIALSPALAFATLIVVFVPGLYLATIAPELDAVVDTTTTVAAGAIAAVAWIRFREADQPDALYQASAFLLLFAGGLAGLIIQLFNLAGTFGLSARAPTQAPIYVWTFEQLIAAALLVVGARTALRGQRLTLALPPAVVLFGPIGLVALFGAAIMAMPTLPALVPPSILANPTATVPVINPLMLFAQLGIAGLFLLAALNYARLHAADRSPYSASLEIALIIAAFGQIHSVIVPDAYIGLVGSGDLLRITFYFVLLLGVASAARGDLRALRRANESLVELRAREAERAAQDERARIAQEIHDGLVQELWLARLTNAELKQMPRLSNDARGLSTKVDGMLEDALAEARYAVASLQPAPPTKTVGADLQRLTDDYANHFDMEIELTVDDDPPVADDVRSQLRAICREALNNVRKHADASFVRVRLKADGGRLRLMVSDNGSGFDVTVNPAGYGLSGMRQRAAKVGGELHVDSEPQGGTRIIVDVPMLGGGVSAAGKVGPANVAPGNISSSEVGL